MDNITQEQYLSVLAFMETFHQYSYEQALKIMQQSNFSIQEATQKRNNQAEPNNNPNAANRNNNNQYNQLNQNQPQPEYHQHELQNYEELSKRYLLSRYVQPKKKEKWGKKYCQCFAKIGRKFTQVFVPQMIKRKLIRSTFHQLYQDNCVIFLSNQTITQAIKNSKSQKTAQNLLQRRRLRERQDRNINNRNNNLNLNDINLNIYNMLLGINIQKLLLKKNLFIVVSGNQNSKCIEEFLRKKKLLQLITEDYQFVGVVDRDLETDGEFKQLYPNLTINKDMNRQDKKRSSKNQNMNSSRVALDKTQNFANNSSISTKKSLKQSSISSSASTTISHMRHSIQISAPCVLIMRQNHLQKLQLIELFPTQEQISQINQQTLKELQQKITASIKRQNQMIKKISEKWGKEHGVALGLRRQEEQQFQNQNRNLQTEAAEQFIQNQRQNRIIAQQNKQYKQMQLKKQERQQAQKIRQQELENYIQQRQCRKLSLPEQPNQSQVSTDNIIRIIFRCPNGENISRKFDKRQKCEILFAWVQLNDQIEFEEDQEFKEVIEKNTTVGARKSSSQRVIAKERKFDLLYNYPPESLKEKCGMELGEVFQEGQIKILIKQL